MKKKDLIVIVGLLVMIGIGYFIYSLLFTTDNYTYVYYKNEQIDKIDLNKNKTYTYTGDYGSFSLEVKDHRYHAVNVECPNHDCEKVGWVDEGSSTSIICVPNSIYVQQTNTNQNVD
jgi:hypothetical protein